MNEVNVRMTNLLGFFAAHNTIEEYRRKKNSNNNNNHSSAWLSEHTIHSNHVCLRRFIAQIH